MDIKYTWKIEDLYVDQTAWKKDYEKAQNEIDFERFRGKLGNAESFLECMKAQEEVSKIIEKLSVYAMMKHDIDTANSSYDALTSLATALAVKINSACSYITPELTALDEGIIESYIENSKLKDYDYILKGILKEKKHILSQKEEKLIAECGEVFSSFHEIFTKIDNADLPLKEVVFGKQKIPLSHGTYSVLMQNPDRKLRKKAFSDYYSAYISLINVITSTYYGSVKKDVFSAKARNYKSALNMALSNEDVDEKVYFNLIKSVNKALPLLHRYIRQKKSALSLKTMHMYDMYVPIVENADLKLGYDEAYDLVVKGLEVLGKDYQALLRKGKDERWIDVYETKNKRSGAYSVACYGNHPYVLLNYQQTTHDVFTIAHEMGHSIHSYFSNGTQPYAKADYKIFVAEVASTVNEVLLIKYLLKTATDKNLKKYLLSYFLEMLRTTLFRQTQFAEFEQFSHKTVEDGEPLTKDLLNEKYLELNKKYYGRAIRSDEEIKYEWARIPHFYRAFYVYKYATGIISALAISERIINEGKGAVNDYFEFLKSGGSDAPTELLKKAGIDLNTKEPFESAFKAFKDALDEFESIN